MVKLTHYINLKLKEEKQLFNSFDPAPFLERNIDNNAAEYILESVKEYPLKRKMKLIILLPKLMVRLCELYFQNDLQP